LTKKLDVEAIRRQTLTMESPKSVDKGLQSPHQEGSREDMKPELQSGLELMQDLVEP
jgi:hypothetical protein